MAERERPLDEERLAYHAPALESLGSLAELTKTDTSTDLGDDGPAYGPGVPGS